MTWMRVAAGAAILFVIAGSAYLFIGKKNIHISAATVKTNKHYKNDIAPGGNKAKRAAPENSSGCYSVTLNNINC